MIVSSLLTFVDTPSAVNVKEDDEEDDDDIEVEGTTTAKDCVSWTRIVDHSNSRTMVAEEADDEDEDVEDMLPFVVVDRTPIRMKE